MLGAKIQMLRKNKGYSQEVLAKKLHVVRQTVSKWEKELSVPDAEILKNIADVFDVSVNELLDSKIPEPIEKDDLEAIAQQLAIINEQYSEQNSKRNKVMKYIRYAVYVIMILGILAAVLPRWNEMWNDFGRNLFHSLNG